MTLLRFPRSSLGAFGRSALGARGRQDSPLLVFAAYGPVGTAKTYVVAVNTASGAIEWVYDATTSPWGLSGGGGGPTLRCARCGADGVWLIFAASVGTYSASSGANITRGTYRLVRLRYDDGVPNLDVTREIPAPMHVLGSNTQTTPDVETAITTLGSRVYCWTKSPVSWNDGLSGYHNGAVWYYDTADGTEHAVSYNSRDGLSGHEWLASPGILATQFGANVEFLKTGPLHPIRIAANGLLWFAGDRRWNTHDLDWALVSRGPYYPFDVRRHRLLAFRTGNSEAHISITTDYLARNLPWIEAATAPDDDGSVACDGSGTFWCTGTTSGVRATRRFVSPSGITASAWPLPAGWRSAGFVRLEQGDIVRLETQSTLSTNWRVSRASGDLASVSWSVACDPAYRTGIEATCIGFGLAQRGNGFSPPSAERW